MVGISLEFLDIADCSLITWEGLSQLLVELNYLLRIGIKHCPGLRNHVETLRNKFPNVTFEM